MDHVEPQNNRGRAERPAAAEGIAWMQDEYKPDVLGAIMRGNQAVSAAASISDTDERSGLSEQSQRRIGTHLRALYEGIVQQPVPDRFRDLIAKLEASDRSDI